jgi:hypothetical protein
LNQYSNLGFKLYNIKNIYKDKDAIVYVPYSLDELTTVEFVKHQVEIHERIAKSASTKWLTVEE